MGTSARAYALTDKAFRYLDRFGHLSAPEGGRARSRPAPPQAPVVALPCGLCPVCGNAATVLEGRMGLHRRGEHSWWCRGYGQRPMQMVEVS